MDSGTRERVEDWETVPFDGGIDGLRDLADSDFSGAVIGGGAWLFMLNGRIIGIFEGDLSSFDGAEGTAYRAPDESLPLLFTMRELGGETQGKYYTEDTAIADVHRTLSDGSFTGYLELSENVLSGDYYVCYYGGQSMPVAFIGNAERLETDEEAFERADDEVGIFEVRSVDIDVVELPEPDDGDAAEDATSETEPSSEATAMGPVDDAETSSDGTDAGSGEGPSGTDGSAASADGTDGSEDKTNAADDGSSATAAGASAAASGTRADDDTDDDGAAGGDDGTATGAPREDGPTGESGAERRDVTGKDRDETTTDRTGTATGSGDETVGETGDERREESSRRRDETGGKRDRRDRNGSDRHDSGTDRAGDRPAREHRENREGGTSRDDGTAGRSGNRTGSDRSRSDSGRSSRNRGERRPSEDRSGSDRQRTNATGSSGSRGRRSGSSNGSNGGADPLASPGAGSSGGDAESPFQREEQWRETSTIPSLDPDHTEEAEDSGGGGTATPMPSSDSGGPDRGEGTTTPAGSAQSSGTVNGEHLEADMLEREDRIDQLQQQVSDLEAERDRLRSERERLAAENERLETETEGLEEENERLEAETEALEEENERLESRVAELQEEVERLEGKLEDMREELAEARAAETTGATGGGDSGSTQIGPSRALGETNLFVRYVSKGKPTLEDGHESGADREAVNENLRIEHHTGFDAENATVGDQPYEEFLDDTLEFQFVDWAIRDLLFEIRDTDNTGELGDLFDALPEVDRAELDGEVAVEDADGEGDHSERFDVVLRDRMGNPLAVANLNDSRDPATQGMMVSLQEAATRVKETQDSLAAAFMVTTSYFEPGALETADEATSGSLLSRDPRRSFVKLSRKKGYHLCLVETRGGNFHVNVPEL